MITTALKNNGFLFLSTPNEDKMSLKKNHNKFHFRHYTNAMISKLFAKYHLEIIAQYGQDTYTMNHKGIITSTLSEDKMKLTKDYNGQFMIYILRIVK